MRDSKLPLGLCICLGDGLQGVLEQGMYVLSMEAGLCTTVHLPGCILSLCSMCIQVNPHLDAIQYNMTKLTDGYYYP